MKLWRLFVRPVIVGDKTINSRTESENNISGIAGNLSTDGIEIRKANNIRPENFCIVGERCSGTNMAREVVKRYLKISFDSWKIYGWKHGFPQNVGYAENALIIVMFRDPVSWVKSLYRKPWHAIESVQQLSFSEFIRTPWESAAFPANQIGLSENHPIVGQPLQFDRHPISGKVFETPLDLRNTKNQGFLGIANRSVNVAFVRMESLIEDPRLIMSCLSLAFDLEMPTKVNLPTKTLGQHTRTTPLHSPAPDTLNNQDTAFIRDRLDLSVESRLGYSV